MIRYLTRDDIDDDNWNRCINRAFNGNIYGHSWFLDIVAGEWDALVEGSYERVFPLVYKKKMGISYLYQPFFTQQLGLFSTSILNQDILSRFIEAIPAKFRLAEINLNTLNHPDPDKYKFIPQLNHELDLIHSYDKISTGYSENLLRNIKKAEGSGLTLVKNIRPEVVVDLFRNNRGSSIRHLKDPDYLRLKRIAYAAMHKGKADVWGITDEMNQFVAGAFFLHSHNKAVFLFSGLSREGRNLSAMPFLIDLFIREHAGRHITFDFDGSNDPNLARFYKSFGSNECWYQRLYLDRLPAGSGALVKMLRKLRRKLP